VTGDDGETREYELPRGSHINVQEGERVKAGEPLMDGPIDPHEILRVRGEKELQRYLVDEIQEVYRLQGVNINDKHIEVISRQMMRWVKVEEVGDREFPIDEVVDRFRFMAQNNKLVGWSTPRHLTGARLQAGLLEAFRLLRPRGRADRGACGPPAARGCGCRARAQWPGESVRGCRAPIPASDTAAAAEAPGAAGACRPSTGRGRSG
jgi:RNA polymerase Rpb1